MDSQQEELKRVETVFNTASDHFDAPALSFWNRFGQQTVDQLGLKAGDRVLDVCCGSGASAIPSAIKVGTTGQVIAVDIADSLLALGRHKAQQQGLGNIEFRRGDFEALGFPDESFDAIVCVFGIFFVPDMVAAVQTLWRMVRPGGTLAITSWGERIFEPANQAFWSAIAAERPDLYKVNTPWYQISTTAALQTLLESSGATEVTVVAETAIHPIHAPEDWWTMVMGGGCRGTIEQIEPATRERIRETNLQFLREQDIHGLEADVLYAIAQKR